MALIRREQTRPFTAQERLNRWRSDIERFFGFPFSTWPEGTWLGTAAVPTDVVEEKDKFIITAELPGLKKEDIDISVEGNTLCICGERKQEQEEIKADYYQCERAYGRFQREVTLPQSVEPSKVSAEYKQGVLKIIIPKTEQAKRKSIEIRTT
jgi:HSP20 family protein